MVVGDRLRFYFSTRSGYVSTNQSQHHLSCSTGVAHLRREGFASLQAQAQISITSSGWVLTRQLRFAPSDSAPWDPRGLWLNLNTSTPGSSLKLKILKAGAIVAESAPITGIDSTKQLVNFTRGDAMGAISGGVPFSIKFYFAGGAQLFAFWISTDECGTSGGHVAAGGPGFAMGRDQVCIKSDDHLTPIWQQQIPMDLLVEFRPSPLFGVDSPRPRFSWSLSAAERDVSSAAYQIIVSNRDDHDSASTAWDSGKVASAASHLVECGVALKPDTRYEWKVRWWATTSGSPSPFSAIALLHTGLFSTADWHGAVPIGSLSVNTTSADPKVCAKAGACRMISTKEIKNTDGYFEGEYSELHSAKTVPACLVACETDPACKQATWDPHHTSPTGFAKCATFKSIGPNFIATVGVATGWVKLSGSFFAGENGHAPGVLCPVKGYPASCTWFETFADSSKHFVTDCDSYPKACGPAQLGCWPDFDSQLPIKQVNASYLTGLTLGANYSCSMLNFHLPLTPPPPPAPPPPVKHAAAQLRKTFTVSGSVVRATAFVSGVGFVDAFINGQAVAPHDRLNPGRTVFDMRQSYIAYDVTTLIESNSKNAVAIWLGSGWQSMRHDDLGPTPGPHTPAARLLLSITTSDGKTQTVPTDLSWKGSRDGPIRDNDICE